MQRFISRLRELNESITMYLAQLLELAWGCKYGAGLEDMLRDRIVCG